MVQNSVWNLGGSQIAFECTNLVCFFEPTSDPFLCPPTIDKQKWIEKTETIGLGASNKTFIFNFDNKSQWVLIFYFFFHFFNDWWFYIKITINWIIFNKIWLYEQFKALIHLNIDKSNLIFLPKHDTLSFHNIMIIFLTL